MSYNNSKLPTKGFLEERNWPVVTIFHLFFSIADFCQPQLTNPRRYQLTEGDFTDFPENGQKSLNVDFWLKMAIFDQTSTPSYGSPHL